MLQFWWVTYPYIALVIMIVGSLYRFTYRPISWTSKSSEMLEKSALRWGSMLFHWGMLFVIIGHAMGLIVPIQFYNGLGISAEFYHFNAMLFGGIAGVVTCLGALILLFRRIINPRVRINSSTSDFISLGLLTLVLLLGTSVTFSGLITGPYEYRATVGPWFRGLLTLNPNAALMAGVPLLLQVHIVCAFLLFAISPFTRLVHLWSFPFSYASRPPLQYRSRTRYRKLEPRRD